MQDNQAVQRLSQRVAGLKPSGIRRFFDIAATMKDVISLGIGEPDFTTQTDPRCGHPFASKWWKRCTSMPERWNYAKVLLKICKSYMV